MTVQHKMFFIHIRKHTVKLDQIFSCNLMWLHFSGHPMYINIHQQLLMSLLRTVFNSCMSLGSMLKDTSPLTHTHHLLSPFSFKAHCAGSADTNPVLAGKVNYNGLCRSIMPPVAMIWLLWLWKKESNHHTTYWDLFPPNNPLLLIWSSTGGWAGLVFLCSCFIFVPRAALFTSA